MPEATFGGEWLHPTIPAMAAAYLFHLCQNHVFLDGNKRIGANAASRLKPEPRRERRLTQPKPDSLFRYRATKRGPPHATRDTISV